jgi:hypothetical protein
MSDSQDKSGDINIEQHTDSSQHVTQIGHADTVIIGGKTAADSDPVDHLPTRTYGKFIGREDDLNRLVAELQREQGPVLAIYGMGGIGKTTLAQEVIEQVKQRMFDGIVWISAKETFFLGQQTQQVAAPALDLDSVLGDIARQTRQFEMAAQPFEQRRQALEVYLKQRRVLVVLDNLETVENSTALVADLHRMIGGSRLLLTSRHDIDYTAAQGYRLRGLDETAGIAFLKQVALELNVEAIQHAPITKLLELHEKTGGAPLAMRLVVGQLGTQTLDTVLEQLQTADMDTANYEFYSFIYHQSWARLDEPAREVLITMAAFAPNEGGPVAAIQQVADVGDHFGRAIGQLARMSLVEKGGSLGDERYALHPLTWNFVMGDIIQQW